MWAAVTEVRRPRLKLSVNKRHVPHGHRLCLGVHQHLVPAVQDNRLVIGVTNLAADQIYYFVVTAYTVDHMESLPSNELTYASPGHLSIAVDPDANQVSLSFVVNPGDSWELQASRDLLVWHTLMHTNAVSNGLLDYSLAANSRQAFFRLCRGPLR